ncbi:MAG: hypothetical protein AB7L41_09965 [Flavobacteriaceae bacterium]
MSIVDSIARTISDFRDLLYARTIPHSHLRNRLTKALIITLLVDLIASLLFYRLERGADGSDIHNYWDAFYFVSSQLTTLSSSMANPVTRPGEVLCLTINLYAITVVASVAGMFSGFFARRSADLGDEAEKAARERETAD